MILLVQPDDNCRDASEPRNGWLAGSSGLGYHGRLDSYFTT
jgi:hypothetical protein